MSEHHRLAVLGLTLNVRAISLILFPWRRNDSALVLAVLFITDIIPRYSVLFYTIHRFHRGLLPNDLLYVYWLVAG